MAEKLNWNFSVQVVGGPHIGAGDTMDVEAYDKIMVDLDDNVTDKKVDIAPGAAGAIKLLIINPAKPDEKLTYKLGANDVKLDGPLVLIGSGAVSLIAATAGSLSLTNKTGAAASIEILVARDATP